MYQGIFLLTSLAAFPVQLCFCFAGRNRLIRRLPLLMILLLNIVCAAAAAVPVIGEWRLVAGILLVQGLCQLAADGLGWLVWAVVKWIQNRRK